MIVRNFFANLLGQFLYPLLLLLLVPFYIHHLGLEGYGLIGFFSTLIMVMSIFTKGWTSALQREIARRDSEAAERITLHGLIRTFEIAYWAVGASLALLMILGATFISTKWLHLKTIPPADVRLCLIALAVTIALSFPNSIYQAVFIGMQRQVLFNIVNVGIALFSAASGVIAIFVWKSVMAFYFANLFSGIVGMAIMRHNANRCLPDCIRGRASWNEFRSMWRLAVGLIWTNGIGMIITQVDRLMVSKVFPVNMLGIYTAGVSGGRLLWMVYNPFLSAVYPLTCQIAKKNDMKHLANDLLRNSRVIMLLSINIGLFISIMAKDILWVWVHNVTVVAGGGGVMAIFVWGNVMISLASVPYQVQMALGVTRYGVYYNTLSMLWYPFLVYMLLNTNGLVGAAWAWIVYASGVWIFQLITTNHLLRGGRALIDYFRSLGTVTACALIIVGGGRKIAYHVFPQSSWGRLVIGGVSIICSLVIGYLLVFGLKIPREFRLIQRYFSMDSDERADS